MKTFLEADKAYLLNKSSIRLPDHLYHKLESVKVGSVSRVKKCYILNNFWVHKVKDYTAR